MVGETDDHDVICIPRYLEGTGAERDPSLEAATPPEEGVEGLNSATGRSVTTVGRGVEGWHAMHNKTVRVLPPLSSFPCVSWYPSLRLGRDAWSMVK